MIEVKNINAYYGKKQVLDNVSFSSKKGECIGILGFNGCGKSTLLTILAGIQKPKSGEIIYDTENALSNGKINKSIFSKKIGFVPQENPLIPELSVYDNLKLWYNKKEDLDNDLKNGLLHKLGVDTYIEKKVNQLSGGMKKRVSIAIATISKPDILILDEPGAALDLACKEDIKEYLSEYLKEGKNVIITTHEDIELDLCDKLFVLKNMKLSEVDKNLRGKKLVEKY